MIDSRKTTPGPSRPAPPLEAAELCPLGLMLSEQRRLIWCNDRFAALFGYAQAELLGQSLALLYPSVAEFQRIGDRGLKLMTAAGEYQDERLMRLNTGRLQWFRVHGRAWDRADPFQVACWTFEALGAGAGTTLLSPREREVLAAMTRGLTSKQSGQELGISPRTVEKLRWALREKFGARNAAELMSRVVGLPD